VPAQWSQVASDVLAQKYFRKAGVPARLKRVEENNVPSFLWRSVADLEALAAGGMDAVTAHHLALAAPQRLLVLGTALAPMLGKVLYKPLTRVLSSGCMEQACLYDSR
jgi:hypothetical protein